MPTYVYRCDRCNHSFERFQSIQADAQTVCPLCGGAVRHVYRETGGFLIRNQNASVAGARTGCCSHGEQCDHPKRCCEH